MNPIRLTCTQCSRSYPFAEPRWKCDCGGLLDIHHTPVFDKEDISRGAPGMWRYRKALPLADSTTVVSLGEPMTPLVRISVNGRDILVKQEQLFPTGSFKDRGAALLVSHARSIGLKQVVEDSSGNAGSSIAAYCARAGIACRIYVPSSTSAGKLAQIQAYGAELHQVEGGRDDTATAALAAATFDYYASHSWNPFFIHGVKTFAFEACEQLGWTAPDTILLPVGNGTLLLGAYTGFCELLSAGLIDHLPRLIGVQSAACDPLVRLQETTLAPGSGQRGFRPQPTLAEGIAVPNPVRWRQIQLAVQQSDGSFIRVQEAEIQKAHAYMRRIGFFIEPTAAVAIAGLRHYQPSSRQETILTALTGHGLKASSFNVG